MDSQSSEDDPTFPVDNIYNDPSAEIVFVAQNKKEYRVHKHLVKRLRITSSEGDLSSRMHTNLSSPVLGAYVNLIYTIALNLRPFISCSFTYHNISMLLGETSGIISRSIEVNILTILGERASQAPWMVLSIASQRDDLDLAKLALRSMGDGDWKKMEKYDEMDYEVFEHITKPYLFELLRLRGACVSRIAPPNQTPVFGAPSRPNTPPVSGINSTFGVLSRSTATSAFTFNPSNASGSATVKVEKDHGGEAQTRASAAYWKEIAKRFAPKMKAEKRKREDEGGSAVGA